MFPNMQFKPLPQAQSLNKIKANPDIPSFGEGAFSLSDGDRSLEANGLGYPPSAPTSDGFLAQPQRKTGHLQVPKGSFKGTEPSSKGTGKGPKSSYSEIMHASRSSGEPQSSFVRGPDGSVYEVKP